MVLLDRARARPSVRRTAQALVFLLLVFAVVSHQRDIGSLQSSRSREANTSKVVTAILADACGAADFKRLRKQGLVTECRLARRGEIDTAIKTELPKNNNDPVKVREDLGSRTTSVSTESRTIDAAVDDWFASHDLALTPGYTMALQNAVTATLQRNPALRGRNGRDATPQQISAAVAAYLVANPPRDGADGQDGRAILSTALDGCAVVFTYSDGTTDRVGPVCGKDGRDGPPPTDDQVNAAVAAYCGEGDRCRGPRGEAGYPESITLADGQECTDPDGDRNYTCTIVGPVGG